jgi:tetraacyldisaccharide 4'-kinase
MNMFAAWLVQQWQKRGLLACVLWPLHALMTLLVLFRRSLYRHGLLQSQKLAVPVLVVGNRVAGGAGKTPTVIALVEHLQRLGWTPGVLSRGYGRRLPPSDEETLPGHSLVVNARTSHQLDARQVGDEPWLIWQRTHVPLGIGSDRYTAGKALLAEHPTIDILVMDDGLQHLSLARDLEIVVFDERGAGNGWLLPAGLLREPIRVSPGPGCQQAPVVLYNAEKPSTRLAGYVAHRQLQSLVPLSAWWAGRRVKSETPPLPNTPASNCWAVAGIAQPQRFFDALTRMGLAFTPCPLADHASLRTLPWPKSVQHVIMTEKDAIKLSPARLAKERPDCQVWVAPMVLQPEPAFWAALDQSLAGWGSHAPTMPATLVPPQPVHAPLPPSSPHHGHATD